jgi:Asp-tRNA(Asn)/Glu-tRNA(Gln) amidotransferase A subunit family amidase
MRLFHPVRSAFLVLILSANPFLSSAQSRTDTLRHLQENLRWSDLEFTEPETDSMLDGLLEYKAMYAALHRRMPPNQLVFPFAFTPAPGLRVPTRRERINWDVPANVSLPARRDELAFYSIPQLASLLQQKKISSVELTRFFLDRLKKWGDTLQCVITLTEDLALQQARQADEEMAQGIYRGPLQGIPYGLKDLFAVKGTRTTWGSTPYKDQVIDEDAYVYKQLRGAGAVLCAKLSLGALAYDNKWFGGATKNPWNLNQGSSGSSAGSAAATAAGLLPFAIGTETWGSIVSPSARCGVTGLRPTFGTVARSGGMVLSWSLDKIGPICRSAEDAAIVYAFIHGTDNKDPGSIRHTFNYTGQIPDTRKLRVAYAANYFRRLDSNAAEWKVVELYRSLGADVKAVIFPDSAFYPNDLMNIVISAEAAAAFDELTRSNRDDLLERQDKNFWPNIFRTARTIPAVEYINANRWRSQLCRDMDGFMRNFDVLIVPSFAGNQLAITNLTGHPVVCMPIGPGRNGNPLSISLLGNWYEEATLLAIAKLFQDKTSFHLQHPPLFSK